MRQEKRIVYDSIYKCDCCGKEYGHYIGSLKLDRAFLNYTIFHMFGNRRQHYRIRECYDLCNDCAKAVDEFIRKGKQINDRMGTRETIS